VLNRSARIRDKALDVSIFELLSQHLRSLLTNDTYFTMELAICEYYDICRVSFQKLFVAVQTPARNFSDQISVATVRDERGRFEVWAGNVGAHHTPKSRISLDYRLRESSFYRERIIGILKDLDDTLQRGMYT
jgi:hypothetical protein